MVLKFWSIRENFMEEKSVLNMNVEDKIVDDAMDAVSDKMIPVTAFFGKMLGIISKETFWSIIKVDLLHRNLVANTANLYMNYQNNLVLRENQYTLDSINTQISELKKIIMEQADIEKRENFARDMIFNMNKFSRKLSESKDNVYIALESRILLSVIKANEISTSTFSQISDKEYFDSTLEGLQKMSACISDEESKCLEGFLTAYEIASELIEKVSGLENVKVLNGPETLKTAGKKNVPEILQIEPELHEEIESPSPNLSRYSNILRNYISDVNELDSLFEKFFSAKKEYELNTIESGFTSLIIDAMEKEKKYTDFTNATDECLKAINLYLDKHPEIQTHYSKLSYDENKKECKTIDCNALMTDCQEKLKRENEKLDEYYQKEKKLIELKKEAVSAENASKTKKKGFWLFGKK